MKKKAASFVLGVLLVTALASCGGGDSRTSKDEHKHDWIDATCTRPLTCSICGETAGGPLGHTWRDATCQAPMTCAVCGETTGAPLEHQWLAATCETPETCSLCGETRGEALGHTLDEAGRCETCGQQIGIPLTLDNYSQYFSLTGHESFYVGAAPQDKKYYMPYASFWFTGKAASGYTYHNVGIAMKAVPANSKYWGEAYTQTRCDENGVLGDSHAGYTGVSHKGEMNSYNTKTNKSTYYSSEASAKAVGAPNYSWSVLSISGYVLPVE